MNRKKQDFSRLKREVHKMPAYVRRAIVNRGLMKAYRERPPYQQNDYIGWITRANLETTRRKRLAQMLAELARGDRYMKMDYKPKERANMLPYMARDLRIASRRLGDKTDPAISGKKMRRRVAGIK